MTDILITHATIATLDQRNQIMENAALLVRDGLIAASGTTADLRA